MAEQEIDTRNHDKKLETWDTGEYRGEFRVESEYAIQALRNPRVVLERHAGALQRVVIGWSSACPGYDAGQRGRLLRVYVSGSGGYLSVDLARDATPDQRRKYG